MNNLESKFTGTVNGVEFNDPNKFIDHLNKLIEEGQQVIEASSTSTTAGDANFNQSCCCGCDSGGECCGNQNVSKKYFPLFEDDDNYYLDRDDLTPELIKTQLNTFVNTLDDNLDKLCTCQLKNYLQTIYDIEGAINSDETFAASKLASLEKSISAWSDAMDDINVKIAKARRLLDQMHKYAEKIDIVKQFYQYLEGNVKSRVDAANQVKVAVHDRTKEPASGGLGELDVLKQLSDLDDLDNPKFNELMDGYRRLLRSIISSK